MKIKRILLSSVLGLVAGTGSAFAQGQTLTIATVNNADMIIMQQLSPKWEQATGHQAELGGARGERAAPAGRPRTSPPRAASSTS